MLDERSSYRVNGIELDGPLCVMPDRMAIIALPFYWIKNGGYPMTSAQTVQFFYHSANDGFISAARTIDLINDDLQEITDNFNLAFIIANFFAS